MGEALVLLVAIVVVSAGGAIIVLSVAGRHERRLARSPALALEVGDQWYRHAVRLARLLERLQRDDMVAVTIPPDVKVEISAALDGFWSVHRK